MCLACWRPSQDLCALPHPRIGVLLEVCRGCYVLGETRRLASRLQENTEFYRLFVARATALYLEVRTALAVEEESPPNSDDGSPTR